MIQPQGLHIIAELSGCNSEKIGDEAFVKQALTEAAHHANAVICELSFHKFSPSGISGVVVIAESHLSIHTWPELGYAAIDIYTCGEHTKPEMASSYLAEIFDATSVRVMKIERGLKDEAGVYSHRIGD